MFGCQSWSWRNKYRTTPFPSDLFRLLDEKIINPNEITFDEGKPYTPFQQLMFILPPQLMSILPKEFEEVVIANNKQDAIKAALKNNPEAKAIHSDWTYKI